MQLCAGVEEEGDPRTCCHTARVVLPPFVCKDLETIVLSVCVRVRVCVCVCVCAFVCVCVCVCVHKDDILCCYDMTYDEERWGAGVEYHFQEFNEPYAPS